jgi:predicted kinase
MSVPTDGTTRPPLVVICGPPGAGKSTLAKTLSVNVRLPVIAKDGIKEALMDQLGADTAMGAAAFEVQLAVARTLLESGCGLILEGAFLHDQINIAGLVALGRSAVVHVTAPLDCLTERYAARHVDRHPGHRGLEALPDLAERVRAGAYELPDLGVPVLRVDSADGFEPSDTEIEAWLINKLSLVAVDHMGTSARQSSGD